MLITRWLNVVGYILIMSTCINTDDYVVGIVAGIIVVSGDIVGVDIFGFCVYACFHSTPASLAPLCSGSLYPGHTGVVQYWDSFQELFTILKGEFCWS